MLKMDTPGSSCNPKLLDKCKICDSLDGKYTCPRCNILYCSLACYKSKSHSNCSENFYQECVREELESMEVGSVEKKKMEEILKNLKTQIDGAISDEDSGEEEIDSDDDNCDDLAQRLAGVNLDDGDAVWEKLNTEERKEFSKLLASGKIRESLPEWDPWWVSGEDIPPLAPDIPSISALTKQLPSPILPFLVMNTIVAYQLALRVLRGEKNVLSVEAATAIWLLSTPLRGPISAPCSSLEDALKLVLLESKKLSWMSDFPLDCEKMAIDLRDLTIIDNCNVLLALSDCKAIFDEAAQIVPDSQDAIRFTGVPPKASNMKKASKKLVFYLAWAKQFDDDEWDRLVGNESPNIIEC